MWSQSGQRLYTAVRSGTDGTSLNLTYEAKSHVYGSVMLQCTVYYVCMYVYMYVCVCMYVCMCVCMYVVRT